MPATSEKRLPIAATKCRVRNWLTCCLGGLAVLLFASCSEPAMCESGLCPTGTTCAPDTGKCVANVTVGGSKIEVFGRFSSLASTGESRSFVAWVPSQQSLAFINEGTTKTTTTWIAGPARLEDDAPAGRVSAAIAGTDTSLHVAYLTDDGALWHASRLAGKWQRAHVVVVPKHAPGNSLAIARWNGGVAIAFDDRNSGRIGFAHRPAQLQPGADWTLEWIEPPKQPAQVDFAGRLAISAFQSKIALATYDRIGRDLYVATRNNGEWSAVVVAGRNTATSEDTTDAGMPCAMTRGLGGELVVAYRDATANSVVLARSTGGHTKFTTVTDGRYEVAALGVTRTRLVGTDVSVVLLASGRVAVAFQDASRMRIGFARETNTGDFAVAMAPTSERPQLAPRVIPLVDGSASVSWIELNPAANPPAGAITTWNVGVGGILP